MPYIDSEAKWALGGDQGVPARGPENVGELTYEIQQLIQDYLLRRGPLSYAILGEVDWALVGAQIDFHRRIVTPYEEKKEFVNGDVWSPALLRQLQ